MFNYDFDAAIFDMDGTLLDTMPYWRYTTLEFMLHHQLPVSDELLTRMYKTSSRRLVMQVSDQNGLNLDRRAVITEMEGYMNRHYLYDANLKCPSVPAFLERLKRQGVRMCVATGSPRAYARNGLRRLGLLDYFDFVTDNYEGALTKDKPGYFDALLDRLRVSRERCWVFEDALYAMESAKASGLRVCAIEDDAQLADREGIRALADVYIRDYAELM
ncbi:MAG: HAD family phosphatase [Clostridia bacterium]|nr:HAD family phosphatase [Clostridia bacterium]